MAEEATVETQVPQESAPDDAAQASGEEETVMALSSVLDTPAETDDQAQKQSAQDQPAQDAEEEKTTESAPKVNGGIKGRLLEAEKKGEKRGFDAGRQAAERAYASEKAEMQARLAKLEEVEIREAAAQIAKDEGCSEKLALRLARLERGKPAQAEPDQAESAAETKSDRPRDASGRFAQKPEADGDQPSARAKELFAQARDIQRATGLDVLEIFNNDQDIRARVARGEIDFADVAREYNQAGRKRVPAPVRNTGGDGVQVRSFRDMTDEQMAEINRKLAQGYTIDTRK